MDRRITSPIRLLLVEDNPDDVRLTELLLGDQADPRYHFVAVSTLSKALACLGTETFDAVLLDLTLPDSWGLETARAVLRAAPAVPVVVHTGLDDDATAFQAIQEGCQDYLVKGAYRAELINRTICFAIERKWAEYDLQRDQKRLEKYAKIASDWLWEMGPDLKFSAIAGNFFNATGIEARDMVGKTYDDLVDSETPDYDIQDHVNALLHHRPFRNFQFLVRHPRGGRRYFRLSGDPVFRDGTFMGYVGVGSDITALIRQDDDVRRHAEEVVGARRLLELQAAELATLAEEANRQRERAELENRAKSQFLATMSHEIRTPMTGVLGIVEMILSRNLAPDLRAEVETIKESGETLITIINDILDIAKVESGKMVLAEADFLFPSVVDGIQKMFRERARDRGNFIALAIDPTVPEAIRGDAHRIKQILLNLVGNAVKFTENGRITLRTGVASRDNDSLLLRFEVEDTGIGIAADVCEQLFQPFSQADAWTPQRFGGTGLGLAISKKLAELMGGEIGVRSTLGKGSTFWFTVRCREGTRSAELGGARRSDAARRPASNLRILVAEDNRGNQMVIRAFLQPLGTAKIVDDGAKAVAEMTANDYDVVVMDVHMPVMDGLTATRAIRALDGPRSKVPIIALSADVMPENVKAFLDAGMNDAVAKPIDPRQLLATIGHFAGEVVWV